MALPTSGRTAGSGREHDSSDTVSRYCNRRPKIIELALTTCQTVLMKIRKATPMIRCATNCGSFLL